METPLPLAHPSAHPSRAPGAASLPAPCAERTAHSQALTALAQSRGGAGGGLGILLSHPVRKWQGSPRGDCDSHTEGSRYSPLTLQWLLRPPGVLRGAPASRRAGTAWRPPECLSLPRDSVVHQEVSNPWEPQSPSSFPFMTGRAGTWEEAQP